MDHYMCKGTCGHVSGTPGTCGTDGCANKGTDFEKCECGDDMHGKDKDESMKSDDSSAPTNTNE